MSITSTQQKKYERLFKKYPVAISHIRQQFNERRLGVVLGAGIGVSLGFPNWKELIRKIADTPEVNGADLFSNPINRTVTSQMLFQLFKNNYLSTTEGQKTYAHFGDIELRKKWKELVLKVLYDGVSPNYKKWLSASPYMKELVNVIMHTGTMTVTYNFDDTIERLLHVFRESKGSRGYTVVWDSNVQTEKRPNIVYHPNGYLPRKKSEYASRQLVFLEDTFEDQLVDSFSGHYNALHNHYSSTTCLFVGISLEDRTLKHMLRMNSKKCYGHMHYLIQHVKNHKDDATLRTLIDTETKANFDTYNLYTMYLTSEEIKTLMELIQLETIEYDQICRNILKVRKFFLMGAVAAGKSTTFNQFKCFLTFDEWLEEMPPAMELAPSGLPDDIERAIDKWIAEQISKKNTNLKKVTEEKLPCIAIVDRTPSDAYAFFDNDLISPENSETDSEKTVRMETLSGLWKAKAKLHLSKLPNGSSILGGKIIFLQGDIEAMLKRAKQKFREYGTRDLQIQQDELRYIAEGARKLSGKENSVAFVDVTNKTIEQVTKEVAEIIFFGEYQEVDFQHILNSIKAKGRDFYEA